MLFANDRGEQWHLGGILALADAGAVAVDQIGQQNLKQPGNKMMVKRRPDLIVFEKGVHSRKRTGHGGISQIVFRRSSQPKNRNPPMSREVGTHRDVPRIITAVPPL